MDSQPTQSKAEEVVKYEDCTGAAYRIRKGVDRTPLHVSIILYCDDFMIVMRL